jgi:hypothetical protein
MTKLFKYTLDKFSWTELDDWLAEYNLGWEYCITPYTNSHISITLPDDLMLICVLRFGLIEIKND